MKRPDLDYRPANMMDAVLHIAALSAYIPWLEANAGQTPKGGNKAKGTIEEVRAYCLSLGLAESDGDAFFHLKEGTGWKGVKNWRATVNSWKLQGYHPSQKAGGFAASSTPAWEPSNAV